MSSTKFALEGPNPTVSQLVQVSAPLVLYGKCSGKKGYRQLPSAGISTAGSATYVTLQQQDSNKTVYTSGQTNAVTVVLPPALQCAGDSIRLIIDDLHYAVTIQGASTIGGSVPNSQQVALAPVGSIALTTADNIYLDVKFANKTANTVSGNILIVSNASSGTLPTVSGGKAIINFDCDGKVWWGEGHASVCHT